MLQRIRFVGTVLLLGALTAMPATARDPHAGPAMNYHPVDATLATSGHFVGDGLEHFVSEKFEVVIDLREEPPKGHAETLTGRGIDYVHVPVSWKEPTLEQYRRFSEALGKHRDRKVLVQCAANYRASALTYLYRVLAEGVAEAQARQDLEAVWEPNENWSGFIEDVKEAVRGP